MIGPQIFHVLTEFKFEAGDAIANSEALQGAVGKISDAADHALGSMSALSTGIMYQFGLGSGILGALQAAIQSSDKFGASQRKLANIFLSNPNKIAGGAVTFQEAMQASANIMEDIQKKAREFALPAQSLLDTTTMVGAALFPEGLTGKNMDRTVNISRQYLKSAPNLGVDPQMGLQQLVGIASGRSGFHETLFNRLANETEAFQPFKKQGGPQLYNAMTAAKRVDLLEKALGQFSSSTQIVEANARSLSGQMQRLKDDFMGAFSVLKPIGNVLNDTIAPLLKGVADYVETHGSKIIEQFALFTKSFLKDPEALVISLMQLSRVKSDLSFAGKVAGIIGTLTGIKALLEWLGFTFMGGLLTKGLVFFKNIFMEIGASAISLLKVLFPGMSTFQMFFAIAEGLFSVFMSFVTPLVIIFGLMQLISRAIAIAKVEDAKAILGVGMPKDSKEKPLIVQFSESMLKLKVAFYSLVDPIWQVFDGLAHGLSFLFRTSTWFEVLIGAMNLLASAIEQIDAFISGISAGIEYLVNSLYTKSFADISFDGFQEAAMNARQSVFDRNAAAIKDGSAVSNQITNIGKVEIQNAFKENMEPDRIAFTIKEQLMKAATNPSQSTGRSLTAGFVGR